tara:strand:+ start:1172 stop:1855 length:684 start_codon:yes stop_codon:yes gene_type:complete
MGVNNSIPILNTRFVKGNENIIVQKIISSINFKLSTKKICVICISGGTSPLIVLKHLFKKELDWNRIYFFLTDERIVKNNSIHSNFKKITNCINNKKINLFQLYNYNLSVKKNIINYQNHIDNFIFKKNKAAIDLLILGFGKDGHIASIFPDQDSLVCSKSLILNNQNINSFKRISMNMKILKSSDRTFILSYGRKKFDLISKGLNDNLPIFKFINGQKNVEWFYQI